MDTIGIHGIITIHEIPDWCDEEFAIRWAAMTEDEKRARQVRLADGKWQAENLITNTGIALILKNLSVAGQGQLQPVTQILSLGNGSLSGVTRADTSVAGDGFATNSRKAPSSFAVTGFTTTITTNFASGDAVGTITNLGFFGWNGSANATTVTASGALMSHALFSYVKGSSAIAVAYTFTLSN